MGRGPIPVTVVIPTWNEAGQIGECISKAAWAAEIIVADAGSTDDTVSIARGLGARVLEDSGPTIAAQRNSAISAAKNRWVLAVDADERISDPLRQEIARVVAEP